MSERLSVDSVADTIQFQRIGDSPSRRRVRVSSPGNAGDTAGLRQPSISRSASKRIVFEERNGPDLWLITAIVALIAGIAVFAGGVVANQTRDSTPAYESVYVPENVLGGSSK